MKKALLIASLLLLVGCTNERNRDMNAERLGTRNNVETRYNQRFNDRGYSDFGTRYYDEMENMNLNQARDYYDDNFRNVKGDIEDFIIRSNSGLKVDINNREYRDYVINDLEKSMIGYNPRSYLNYDEFAAYRQFIMRYNDMLSNNYKRKTQLR
ncbi:hypothetical protein KHQ82_02060 [Mycoplasmatota bacterium]|nr:hypothetical protein KHQ82_02060 [Mycoplasmatota bacterium]